MKRRDCLLAGWASLSCAIASAQLPLPGELGSALKALSGDRGARYGAGVEPGAVMPPQDALPASSPSAIADKSGRFVISADGIEVTDTQTGLTWTRKMQLIYLKELAAGRKEIRKHAPYDKAVEHAAAISRKTGKSWRLPTVDEFNTLKVRTPEEAQANAGSQDKSTVHDVRAFPSIEPGGARYWTADTLPARAAQPRRAKAITFNPHAGGDFPYEVTLDTKEHIFVMLVRGNTKR